MIGVKADVRKVSRGFWTYDIHFEDGRPPHVALGECHSKREAIVHARRAVKEMTDNPGRYRL